MNQLNYGLVVCSDKSSINDTVICKCLDKTFKGLSNFYFVNNNTDSLASIYNHYISISNDDILIFCHDDVLVEDAFLFEKLDQAIGDNSSFSICGVAGSKCCVIKDKNLWHLMNNVRAFHDCSGCVSHFEEDSEKFFVSVYGKSPERVLLLDGVFFAVNLKIIKRAGLKFDESYPCKFHFYDLDFCLQANKLGLKMMTYPIWLIHKSHGLSADLSEWNKGNEYFKKKWG